MNWYNATISMALLISYVHVTPWIHNNATTNKEILLIIHIHVPMILSMVLTNTMNAVNLLLCCNCKHLLTVIYRHVRGGAETLDSPCEGWG